MFSNRDELTRERQQVLLRRRVGVIGLSVGSSAALACAMEGVGGAFRLADFGPLGLSNLNRLSAGVHDLGVEKSVLCARRMYELDPYLDIEVFRSGVTEDTIEDPFSAPADGDGLDLLVEECDTPWVKVAAREHARRRLTGRLLPRSVDGEGREGYVETCLERNRLRGRLDALDLRACRGRRVRVG
ncbi:ThiF family adenylyltransferase [Streptomyces sp. NPDC002952]|uniref:ThiF family adenylyltransferase n=1 Tax=Streptomyces sp. NPDC002952 TaxID=3364673 RepID=UPI0036AAA74E